MANAKISAFTALTGANVADDDVFAIVDTSVSTTKKITSAELVIAIGGRLTATQTFLAGDVSLNNTSNYFNICNTGSIGASGQVWKIMGVANVLDNGANANILVRIWDGSSSVYVETGVGYPFISSSSGIPVFVQAIVTLTGPTTFHLSAKDLSTTNGVVKTTGSAGTANKATWIIAERIS